jgi:two-component system cell cycle response regulator
MKPAAAHILVVEDDVTQALLTRRRLQGRGYQVTLAQDGHEAMNIVARGQCQMVISDINMPAVDGYTLCRHIKSNPRLRHIPVILLSTLSSTEHILEGLNAQADFFLAKPVNPQMLFDRVEQMLANPPKPEEEPPAKPMEIVIDGVRHQVTANRRQLLTLLVATYDNVIAQNRELGLAQQRLRAAESNHRALLRDSADALVVMEPAGAVRFANPAAERLFRGTAGQIQQQLADLGPRAGESREITLPHPDRQVTAQMRTSPTVWDGQPALLVTLSDISKLKENEERLRELEGIVAEASCPDSGTVRLESLAACLTATADGLPTRPDLIQFSLLSASPRPD